MPGVGNHFYNDAKNKPGGIVGIDSNYNALLDVKNDNQAVYYGFDFPTLYPGVLTGLFGQKKDSTGMMVLQLLLQRSPATDNVQVEMLSHTGSSQIILQAGLLTWLNPYTNTSVNIPDFLTDGILTNGLINGNFDVWQRGTYFTVNTPMYGFIADRWRVNASNGGGTSAMAQITYSKGIGSNGNYLGCAITNVGAYDGTNKCFHVLQQPIEPNIGIQFMGTYATFSAYVTGTVGMKFYFTIGDGGSYSCSPVFTLSNSQNIYSFTVQILNSLTSVGIAFHNAWDGLLNVASGTGGLSFRNMMVTANGASQQYRPPDANMELLKCQRYYIKYSSTAAWSVFCPCWLSYVGAPNNVTVPFWMSAPMRVTPSTYYSNLTANVAGTSAAVTAAGANAFKGNVTMVGMNTTAGTTMWQNGLIQDNGSNTGWIAFDSELY